MKSHSPKVLYFHTEYPLMLGGGASYSKNLIAQLTKLKTKIVLITSGDSDSIEKINNYLTIKRYRVFRDLYYDKGGLMEGIDILLKQIREECPDILHTVYIEETLIGQIANLNYGIPHIVTHTKTPMYREESITKNSTWSLFDYVNRSTSVTYITPGLAYRDGLLESGVESSSIHLIYPGIDQNIFKKIKNPKSLDLLHKRLKIEPQDSVLLIPCRLRKRKGLNFVADALSKLHSPGHKIKVVVTGVPENQEEIQIYRDFKKRIGSVEIVVHDKFSNEDIPVLYNVADVTVLCSEAEGYGTVLLEAMACGCPVIGSDVIGINEVIRNGYNGILCKYGDCQALNEAIIKILTDQTIRDKFVKNSFSVLKSKYNLRKQAENHLRLYKSICDNKQQVSCLLYRSVNRMFNVFLLKIASSYILPRTSKKINESWLQAAIVIARKVSGYQVVIPNHLLLDKNDKNMVSYSFKITLSTPYKKPRAGKDNNGIWLNLDKAIRMVSKVSDKETLRSLKTNLKNDNRTKPL